MRVLIFIAAGAAAVTVEKRGGRVSSLPASATKVPVIGILAQPSTRTPFKQYVASSYVKWVEMAGGVAVPLSYVASNTTTLNLLKQLDGVLLPGGSNPPLPDAARVSVEYARKASTRNESFPVWGTCLGFEWLVEILALTQRENELEPDAVAAPRDPASRRCRHVSWMYRGNVATASVPHRRRGLCKLVLMRRISAWPWS